MGHNVFPERRGVKMDKFAINLPDARLNKRYHDLVKGHIHQTTSIATGVHVPASVENSFTVTQATWRFLNNDRVTPQALVEPLRHFARKELAGAKYTLAVMDWCKLDYGKHTAKKDIVQISHKRDIGYELTTHLLVNAQNGSPIAPIEMHLKTANGILSTAETAPPADDHHLGQVLPMMQNAAATNLPTTLVHVIDREGDSIFHIRQWSAEGFLFLVRGKKRKVRWQGKLMKYSTIAARLEAEGAFRQSRKVTIKGKPGVQHIAETEVVLDRPATHKVNGPMMIIPGEAITLRLVIAKVVDPKSGEVLSTWYLLTNVPSEVPAEQIALWYYFRWQIESFFRLLKKGGQQLEYWQQESGLAILNRLLLASMACAIVWNLQRDKSAESVEFQKELVRLSGKRLKRGHPPTAGILLDGLCSLFRMIDYLDEENSDHSKIGKLKKTAKKFMPELIKS